MTEKRYSKMMNHYGTSRTYCTGIYDNQNNRELENSSQVIYELNALHEENQALKKAVDEADDLIKSHLSTHYNRKWENYCKNIGVDLE